MAIPVHEESSDPSASVVDTVEEEDEEGEDKENNQQQLGSANTDNTRLPQDEPDFTPVFVIED